jgi:hypothetical protein
LKENKILRKGLEQRTGKYKFVIYEKDGLSGFAGKKEQKWLNGNAITVSGKM